MVADTSRSWGIAKSIFFNFRGACSISPSLYILNYIDMFHLYMHTGVKFYTCGILKSSRWYDIYITSEFTTLAQFSSLHQGYQGAISSTRRCLCRWFLVDSHQEKHHLTAGPITGSLHDLATSYVLPFGVSPEPTLTNMFEKVWQKLWKAKCLFLRMLQSFGHGQGRNFMSATSNTF